MNKEKKVDILLTTFLFKTTIIEFRTKMHILSINNKLTVAIATVGRNLLYAFFKSSCRLG